MARREVPRVVVLVDDIDDAVVDAAEQIVLRFISVELRPVLQQRAEEDMIRWAIFFAIVSLIAGLFGFTGVAAGAVTIARALFAVFLVLFLAFIVLGITVGGVISGRP